MARLKGKEEEREENMSDRKRHNYKNLKIMEFRDRSRCSISIPSNAAEDSSRTDKSFSHFLDISLGSYFELETQLIIAFKRKYITKEQLTNIE